MHSVPCKREANSYFEEERATTSGEGQLVDTPAFCQRSVSVSLHSTFRKQYFNQHTVSHHVLLTPGLCLRFVSNFRTTNVFNNRVKLALKANSGTIQAGELRIRSCYFYESLVFFTRVAFLCQNL